MLNKNVKFIYKNREHTGIVREIKADKGKVSFTEPYYKSDWFELSDLTELPETPQKEFNFNFRSFV